jgi:hypothetical protein
LLTFAWGFIWLTFASDMLFSQRIFETDDHRPRPAFL